MEKVRLDVTVNRKTEKAWLIWIEGGASLKNPGATWQTYWVPDSAVVETDCLAEGDKGYMIIKRWIIDQLQLLPGEPKRTTTEELSELEDQLQTVERQERLEVVVGVNIDSLPHNQGDMQISAYLTDEGLVVDVFHGDGEEEVLASGYELFSEAGLEPPQPLEED